MYALFFFWFPYYRDKIVAFGAFRCDLHLSGGIRPYVQQASAASWASQLFHRVFIFFRNHFPPSFGCLCRKGTGQIIPVPFSFVAQGRGGLPQCPSLHLHGIRRFFRSLPAVFIFPFPFRILYVSPLCMDICFSAVSAFPYFYCSSLSSATFME